MEQMINENKIYNAALHCRSSKDDEQAGESVSIGTQKMILEKFSKEQEFRIYDVYVDDVFSGLNFDRLDFQRMLIDKHKIMIYCLKNIHKVFASYHNLW